MNTSPGQKAHCPNCDLELEVAQACPERGCQKRGYHGVPVDYLQGQSQAITPDPMIGCMIDEYLLVGIIGQGGFGKVYLALQMPIQMKTALKLMHRQNKDAQVAEILLKKFQGEAQALATLTHPGVVRLMKYGTFKGLPYLVMELVEGAKTLKKEVTNRAHKGETLSLNEIQHILQQITAALEAAHRRQIVHRDIKPENIMLQSISGNPHFVRILDFGLAKFVAESAETSVAMGTPVYMAPEQLMRKNIGPWTDLYAVGVIAFELITGQRPFAGRTHQEIMASKLDPRFDPTLRIQDQSYPAKVHAFLKRALARDPENRYRTSAEFQADMKEVFNLIQTGSAANQNTDLTALLDSQELQKLDTERRVKEEARRASEDPIAEQIARQQKLREQTTGPRVVIETSLSDTTDPRDTTLRETVPPTHAPVSQATARVDSSSPPNRRSGLAIGLAIAGVAVIGLGIALAFLLGDKTASNAGKDAHVVATDISTTATQDTSITLAVADTSSPPKPDTSATGATVAQPDTQGPNPATIKLFNQAAGLREQACRCETKPCAEPLLVKIKDIVAALKTTKLQENQRSALNLHLQEAEKCHLALKAKPVTTTPGVKIPEGMLRIAAGSYPVGCQKQHASCYEDETKHHTTVKQFAIMRHEVTAGEYAQCVNAGQCRAPQFKRRKKKFRACTYNKTGQEKHPINCVTWYEADQYCQAKGWRLPTELEWEVSARGAQSPRYPWGDTPPTCAMTVMKDGSLGGCGTGGPLAVGSRAKDRSWVGVFDLGGNLREWTQSDYAPYPGGTIFPDTTGKIVRGGSWDIAMEGQVFNTSHLRGTDPPATRRNDIGFRCAKSL